MPTVRELVTKWGFRVDDRPVKSMEASVDRLKNNFTKLRNTSLVAAGAVAGLGAPIGYLIKQAGQMEQWDIAFKVMIGSAEKAGALMQNITSFARTTPFELTGLVESSKQLLAYNISAEKVIPTLQKLGDISAGVGMDKLPRLITALGQVKAAGRLTGMELRQFTETGVPLLQELVTVLGAKDEATVLDQISKGAVKFKDVEQALGNLTSEGGKFFNLMGEQALSTFGLWSNLKDVIDLTAIAVGKQLLPMAKDYISAAIQWLEVNKELVKSNILTFVEESIDFFKDLVTVLHRAWRVFKALTVPIGGVANAFRILTGAVVAYLAVQMLAVLGSAAMVVGTYTKAIYGLARGFNYAGNAALIMKAKVLLIPILVGLAIAALFLIIEDLITYFQGGNSVTEIIIKKFKELAQKFPAFMAEMRQGVVDFVRQIPTLIVDGVEALVKFLYDSFLKVDQFLASIDFSKLFTAEGMSNLLDLFVDGLVSVFKNFLNYIPVFAIGTAIAEGLYLGLVDVLRDRLPMVADYLGLGEDQEFSDSPLGGNIKRLYEGYKDASLRSNGLQVAGVTVPSIQPGIKSNINKSIGPTTANSFKTEVNITTQNLNSEDAKKAVEEGVRKAQSEMLREGKRDLRPAIAE